MDAFLNVYNQVVQVLKQIKGEFPVQGLTDRVDEYLEIDKSYRKTLDHNNQLVKRYNS